MQLPLLLSSVTLLQLGAFTFAHSDGEEFRPPAVFGRQPPVMRHVPRHMIEDVKGYPEPKPQPQPRSKPQLSKRDWSTPDTDSKKKCGPVDGFCKPGDCCSPAGFCGRGYNHCESPNCQIAYSDGCDDQKKPLGAPTLNVSRPLIGNVTYDGKGIDRCKNKGAVALTFDDGPYNYTSHVLDVLASYGAKATFFITGNNLGKGQIDIEQNGWPAIIRRMHADGHQIASHSWGHQNLSSLNDTMLTNQLHYNEMAFRNILGFFPTYLRPPYDDCQDNCQRIVKNMGYHITYQNVVNNDWQNDDETAIEATKKLFVDTMKKSTPNDTDNIFLLHDTHYQTSWNVTSYMLDYFQLMNFRNSVTVGECMGDPPENWYRAASGAPNRSLLMHKTNSGNSLQYSTWRYYSTLTLTFAQFIAYLYL